MASDEPEPQSDDARRSEPDNSGARGHSPSQRNKLPAGWKPKHADGERPRAVFVAEPDPRVTPSIFADKRYQTFRKQMVWAVLVGVIFLALLGVFQWLRPLIFPYEVLPEDTPEPVPSLNAEQLRQQELETVREQLRSALANRNWTEIDRISKQILQKEPADGEAWHAQGWIFEKDRLHAEAADAYGKAIKGGFLPSSCLIKRAAMYRRLGKPADAIADLEESIRLDREPIITPNLLMIAQIEAGNADVVRNSVAAFEKAGIVANADRFLLGKAALEIHEGNFAKAANSLVAFQSAVSPPLFAISVQDSFFDPYRTNPDLGPFLMGH